MAASAPALPSDGQPLIVAISMGYGHLRPAHAMASVIGTPVFECDKEPLADANDQRQWTRTREMYEWASRVSQRPLAGAPMRWLNESITDIPEMYPGRDMSSPTRGLRFLARTIRRKGLGRKLVETLKERNLTLITSYFAPAIIADMAGCERIYCVVTDSDCNRAWASPDSRNTRIRYFAPSSQVRRRLRTYGVPEERIAFTGYPLPDELLGGPDLPVARRNLAARLVRLDPTGVFCETRQAELERALGPRPRQEEGAPPLLTFAVGGAGAQSEIVEQFLPSIGGAIERGKLRLALVAGVRPEVEARFRRYLAAAGLESEIGRGIEVLREPDVAAYFASFNALLARTDLVWSKPSEISFFAGLGIPLILAPPVGIQEVCNRRWLLEQGAAIDQRDPRSAAEWLGDFLDDGQFAASAWSGFTRLPNQGVYRIAEAVACPGGRAPGEN